MPSSIRVSPAGAGLTLLATVLLACAAGPAEAPAQEPTRAQREWVRPESDALPRYPHGRTPEAPPPSGRRFVEMRRFAAPEARQGVAVDDRHFYAVANHEIGKYDRRTGARVGGWKGAPDGPTIHLNSCLVHEGRLVCAHSNHPGIPMLSSVEVWDTETMEHVESRSLGITDGSLTWALPRAGEWWLHFAHYGNYSGVPGKGPEWSTLVRYDSSWTRRAAYAYPVRLLQRLTPNSSSGGNWGPDGRLYVTGHDEPEIYVLRLPEMGSVLEWVETIPAPMAGQAWVFDPGNPREVWGILRGSGEVVVGRLTEGMATGPPPPAGSRNRPDRRRFPARACAGMGEPIDEGGPTAGSPLSFPAKAARSPAPEFPCRAPSPC